jgi:N,N-dimethylformamidase
VVRLHGAWPGGAPRPELIEPMTTPVEGRYAGRLCDTAIGSYVEVPSHPVLALVEGFAVCVYCWPSAPERPWDQGLVAKGVVDGVGGYRLSLGPDAAVRFRVSGPDGAAEVASPIPLREREWYRLEAVFDAGAEELRFTQQPLSPWLAQEAVRSRMPCAAGPEPSRCPLLIGAAHASTPGHAVGAFNGKLEGPVIDQAGGHVAAWVFDPLAPYPHVPDRGPHDLAGVMHNGPLRAVTTHDWNAVHGDDFRVAPEKYAAVYLHEEDIDDAGWPVVAELDVPDHWQSGVYAFRLVSGDQTEFVPFFVAPSSESPKDGLAVLLPTFTYLAYGNYHVTARDHELMRGLGLADRIRPTARNRYLDEHPELGLSLYDYHVDGSVCQSVSRRRPVVDMRPDYVYPLTGAGRHFSADLALLGWLERSGHAYFVITDDDLHRHGLELVRGYPAVLTGSHPEYCTAPMREALAAYVEGGGNLIYLGGNGFYWYASVDGNRPHAIEVRRGNAGTRPGSSGPGESRHIGDGCQGGLWRHLGTPPEALTGVGFVAQGWGEGAGYARLPDAEDPIAAFVFDGVGAEVVGEFGPLGGAAADEIDCVRRSLGTPAAALRLASSRGRHSDHYQRAIEDLLFTLPHRGGADDHELGADMVLCEVPGGGRVFSVGSVAWSLCVSSAPAPNDISRITDNVIREFVGGSAERLGA